MAWFHPEFYHRVLAYSPTVVNQQWPHNPALPGGAWEYHSPWAGPPVADLDVEGDPRLEDEHPLRRAAHSQQPVKPIRIWFEAGDQDLFYPVTPVADGMHDWTLADERFAKVLADKGYHYQFLFSRNAHHVDKATVARPARPSRKVERGSVGERTMIVPFSDPNNSYPASTPCACR